MVLAADPPKNKKFVMKLKVPVLFSLKFKYIYGIFENNTILYLYCTKCDIYHN